jgi:hypothetical protein
MKKELTARQASIIIFIMQFATRLLTLPSLIAINSKQDLWISQLV